MKYSQIWCVRKFSFSLLLIFFFLLFHFICCVCSLSLYCIVCIGRVFPGFIRFFFDLSWWNSIFFQSLLPFSIFIGILFSFAFDIKSILHIEHFIDQNTYRHTICAIFTGSTKKNNATTTKINATYE